MVGYLRAHWDGENSLGYAYWVNGVLIQAGVSFLFLFIVDFTTVVSSLGRLYTLLMLQIAIAIWAMVGIWRSAGNSIATAKREMRYPIWAYLARGAVVLGALHLMASFAGVS